MRSMDVHRPCDAGHVWVEFCGRKTAGSHEYGTVYEAWNREDLRAAIAELIEIANAWDEEDREVKP